MPALPIPAGTAGVAASGPQVLYGFSVRECAVVPAPATLTLRDGADADGPPRAFVAVGAGGVETRTLPGLSFDVGVFVDRTAGSTELVLYVPG
jgi:hypothetical protein